MKRRQKRSYMEISTKGKVSIPGDTARADEAFGPFPSPTRLPSLHKGTIYALHTVRPTGRSRTVGSRLHRSDIPPSLWPMSPKHRSDILLSHACHPSR